MSYSPLVLDQISFWLDVGFKRNKHECNLHYAVILMMTSQNLKSVGFTKTQKSRYLENETLFLLQIKKFINYTSSATLWLRLVLYHWYHFLVFIPFRFRSFLNEISKFAIEFHRKLSLLTYSAWKQSYYLTVLSQNSTNEFCLPINHQNLYFYAQQIWNYFWNINVLRFHWVLI